LENTTVCRNRGLIVYQDTVRSSAKAIEGEKSCTGRGKGDVLGAIASTRFIAIAHTFTLSRRIANVSTVALPSKLDTRRREPGSLASIDTFLDCHLIARDRGHWLVLEQAVSRAISGKYVRYLGLGSEIAQSLLPALSL
jgi:hypothetical protein